MTLDPDPDAARAWALIRQVAHLARRGEPLCVPCDLDLGPDGRLVRSASGPGLVHLDPDAEPCFESRQPLSEPARLLLSLYLPLCVGARSTDLVLGQLGQGLDGHIATAGGASRSLSGDESLLHLHRLRALFDAVLVGASTAVLDDPVLTTRLVPGENPTRVVIDPRLRVSAGCQLFTDGRAPSLRITGATARIDGNRPDLIPIRAPNGLLPPRSMVEALKARGLRRLLVEGGGVTVSRFLRAGALDRLHLCISPVLIGGGRRGIDLEEIASMDQALRPRVRRFDLGRDVLFDCGLGRA